MKIRRVLHKLVRRVVASLPKSTRFAIYRSMVDCDPRPSERLVLKIAETQEELEACFALLHDAYVEAGFMKPDPSGMRVTIYHALPTTTTLCAKWDGQVVGTISLIREGVFGFPMQQIFDLTTVRQQGGALAEVSALAVHRAFRNTGGTILFPLMKFMYEYCRRYFDTRHLLIAVNPNRIELYESLLCFQRLTARVVDHYDFANGAPAVGAALDLQRAPAEFERIYGGKPPRKNLFNYFTRVALPNIHFPSRRYYTTNDPVLTPALLEHFFNVRTQGFTALDDRKKLLLHAVYAAPAYRDVLPGCAPAVAETRQLPRFSVKCPAELRYDDTRVRMTVVDVSSDGFQARTSSQLTIGCSGQVLVKLGENEMARLRASVVRQRAEGAHTYYGLQIDHADAVWKKFASALAKADTHDQLDRATVFMD